MADMRVGGSPGVGPADAQDAGAAAPASAEPAGAPVVRGTAPRGRMAAAAAVSAASAGPVEEKAVPGFIPDPDVVVTESQWGKTVHLTANVSDAKIREALAGFDGREEVFAKVGDQEVKLEYCGTTLDGLDQHAARLSLPPDADVSALLRDGVAFGARVKANGRDVVVWNQLPGGNAPVANVGPVDVNGIAWTGPVTATRIHKYTKWEEPVQPGRPVPWHMSESGIPGAAKNDLVRNQLGLTVESPILRSPGAVRFKAQSGTDGHNFRLSYFLGDPPNSFDYGKPAGRYPFTVRAHGVPVAEFEIDWQK